MARLLVLRGDSLEQEVRLTSGTIHIGRGTHNDIVLDDPGKSVSRDHAQIRYEGGRYVLFDLDSQNGIWVSGVRAPYVVLDSGVAATIGPFQLMYDEADVADFPQRETASQPRAHAGRLVDGRATVADGPRILDDDGSQPDPISPKSGYAKWIAAAGAALVLGGLGFGLTRLLQPPPTEAVPPHLARAVALINAGDCTLALEEIDSIVAANPSDTAATTLRARAATCAQGSSPSASASTTVTADEVAHHLAEARRLLAARECDRALSEHLNPVLAADPSNSEALTLSATANTCPPPRAAAPARPPTAGRFELPPASGDCPAEPARVIPPERGGVPLRDRCESARDYAARVQEMGARYDEAVAALSNGAYDRATTLLERIVHDAGPVYRDAAARLAEARRKWAAKTRATAQEAEQRGELDQAQDRYLQAQDADPSLNLQADIARVVELRQKLGEQACAEAHQAVAFSRQAEALRKYEIVVRMLPPEHPCVVTAKQRFPELRKR